MTATKTLKSLTTVDTVARSLKPVNSFWSWQEDSLCRGMDSSEFFLEFNARRATKQKAIDKAKAICKSCPVIANCLQHALSTPETYVVWGGKSEEERDALIRSGIQDFSHISFE